jgi:hypothetical protein
VKIAGAGKYELLKAIGDELAFAQEELTYLNRLDITKKILLHLGSRCDRAICLLLVCPVKSGSKWRISLWYFNQSLFMLMRGLEKEVSFNLMKPTM